MTDMKNGVPCSTTIGTPIKSSFENDMNTISQANVVNQYVSLEDTPTKNKRFKKDKCRVLGYHQNVYSVAFKFYDEQLPYGEEEFIQAVRDSDKDKVHVLAIKHDRDTVTDGIWELASVKPHWHVIVRMANRKKTMKVSTILSSLNIEYRRGVDDMLWTSHGVESVGDFASYAVYLTHETPEAIRDAKERYDISDIVSNLNEDEIKQIRDGYVRLSDKRRITQDELIALDKEAYDMGYDLKNFDDWYGKQPFVLRSNTKMRTIKESYERGVKVRVDEQQQLIRLCVFIQGDPNTGKTYSSKKALTGKSILSVGGGGSGKFDLLRPDHDAIVIDDDVCPNLLNMTDNYICRAYRRNRNNPVWAGRYFIVTSNLNFEQWLAYCGIMSRTHISAMWTRFFVCRLSPLLDGGYGLQIISSSTRGTSDEIQARQAMFDEFFSSFNKTSFAYQPMP